jgi:hypothetical protein
MPGVRRGNATKLYAGFIVVSLVVPVLVLASELKGCILFLASTCGRFQEVVLLQVAGFIVVSLFVPVLVLLSFPSRCCNRVKVFLPSEPSVVLRYGVVDPLWSSYIR